MLIVILSLNGISAVETIHNVSNKVFDNYSKLIIQFSKYQDTAPNYLYVDIVIKMKTGKLYPPKLQTYMVCYCIKGLQTDVPSNDYDAFWSIDNNKVTFNEPINMGNNAIVGLKSGDDLTGAVNLRQLMNYKDIIEYSSVLLVNQKIHENKNCYEQLFEYWVNCLDPNMFNIHKEVLGAYVSRINKTLTFVNFRNLSQLNIKDGF